MMFNANQYEKAVFNIPEFMPDPDDPTREIENTNLPDILEGFKIPDPTTALIFAVLALAAKLDEFTEVFEETTRE